MSYLKIEFKNIEGEVSFQLQKKIIGWTPPLKNEIRFGTKHGFLPLCRADKGLAVLLKKCIGRMMWLAWTEPLLTARSTEALA